MVMRSVGSGCALSGLSCGIYVSCRHVLQVVQCSCELIWRLECDGFVGEVGGDSLVVLIQGCQDCYVHHY
jgi:hypothetical protein